MARAVVRRGVGLEGDETPEAAWGGPGSEWTHAERTLRSHRPRVGGRELVHTPRKKGAPALRPGRRVSSAGVPVSLGVKGVAAPTQEAERGVWNKSCIHPQKVRVRDTPRDHRGPPFNS